MKPARRPLLVGSILALGTVFAGCAEPKTREWTPTDHDVPAEAPPPGPPRGASTRAGVDELADLAWQRHCVSCHGPEGRGDGPRGAEVGAPDLTRTEGRALLTDAELAAVIRQGRGRMPPVTLPDPAIRALVARIRSRQAR